MLVLILSMLVAFSAPGVVDRVVVVVDEELVLASEIALEQELSTLDRPPVPFWSSDHGTAEDRLEKAAILRLLAAGVALYEPAPAEVEARIVQLREQAGSDAAWLDFQRRWGLDERSATTLVRRRMIVERYLVRNLTEDPSRTTEWLAAADALLKELRPRFRIRHVPERGQAGAP